MTVAKAFANYLVAANGLTLGTNLFISRVPSSNQASDPVWWLKQSGGQVVSRTTQGGALKQYLIEVNMRAYGGEAVDEALQALGDSLTTSFVTFDEYDLYQIEPNGPWTDQDLDNEERSVGLLQVKVIINEEA